MLLRKFGMAARLLGPLSCVVFSCGPASAQEVVLTTDQGDFFSGTLLDYDDNTYRLQTTIGTFVIPAERVTCTGEGCPAPAAEPAPETATTASRPSASPSSLISGDEADIVLSGSSTIGVGLMPLLVSGYASYKAAEEVRRSNHTGTGFSSDLIANEGFGDPLAKFLVRSSVSSDAFANLIGKSSHLGMASRRITPPEARILSDFGAGNMVSPLNEHIIAVDSIAVIVHPDNPLKSLAIGDLEAIFSGQITNWSEVGGPDAPINVVDLIDGSGSRAVFNSRIFPDGLRGTPANLQVVSDNVQASNIVSEDANAIGYVSYAFLRGAKPLVIVNECQLPMIPDTFSARTEEYGLQRFLYFYSRSDQENPQVQDFLRFATSSDADEVIAKSGFIDLGITRRAQPLDGPRGQLLTNERLDPFERGIANQMLDLLPNYDRLSSTFRFRLGSSRLTPRGELNLLRLRDYLEVQPAGTKVVFVGFTDSLGAFTSNLNLAQLRSQRILQEMRRIGGDSLSGIEMSAVGFGELAPTGCNDPNGGGSRINRRVEVWIERS